MEILTNLEHLKSIRNEITKRIVQSTLDMRWFQNVVQHARETSQEMIDSRLEVVKHEENIKKDVAFLKIIDLAIKKGDI